MTALALPNRGAEGKVLARRIGDSALLWESSERSTSMEGWRRRKSFWRGLRDLLVHFPVNEAPSGSS